jgi:hypothetical protein
MTWRGDDAMLRAPQVPIAVKATINIFQIIQFDINSERIPRPLYQTTTSKHSNIVTFTLLL